MFFHRFILGELVTNCYLIADEDTKNAVLFDAPADAEKITAYLDEKGFSLKFICLTHAHFDHILALGEILKKTGAKCLLHTEEEQYLKNPDLNIAGARSDEIGEISGYSLLEGGDEIVLDDIKIDVLHTPGHTKGGVCYLVNDEVLISGDTLFSGSIGRFDFPLGNFNEEINSIKEKLMPLADEINWYPGHGFSTTIGKHRKENPYLI